MSHDTTTDHELFGTTITNTHAMFVGVELGFSAY